MPGALVRVARICWLTTLCALLLPKAPEARISVQLQATWPGAPLAWEALEFLADVSPGQYNEGLAAWLDQEHADQPYSAANCWNFILDSFQPLLPPQLHPLLKFQLATRQYTARLEAFRNIALQNLPDYVEAAACCAASMDGTILPTPYEVSQALKYSDAPSEASPLTDIDHVVLQATAASTPRSLVLYGAPGTPCFAQMHATILGAIAALNITDVVYAVRPVMFARCAPGAGGGSAVTDSSPVTTASCLHVGMETPPVLAGYGIQLDLKNMEYSQLDDATNESVTAHGRTSESAEAGPSDDGTGSGHVLSIRPGADPEQDGRTQQSLKALGLQASVAITQSAHPVAALAELTAALPAYTAALSELEVPSELERAVQRQHTSLVPAGSNALLVNGLMVPLNENVDLPAFQSLILHDALVFNALLNAGFTEVDAEAVLGLRAYDRSSSGTLRVDLRGQAGFWLNDLEKDSIYRGWNRSLAGFIDGVSGFFGMPPRVRRNAINLQLVGQPLHQELMAAAGAVAQIYGAGYSVRIGALFAVPEELDGAFTGSEVGFDDLTLPQQFLRFFCALEVTFDGPSAWHFWGQLVQPKASSPGLDEDEAEEVELEELTPKALADMFIKIWDLLQENRVGGRGALGKMAAGKAAERIQSGPVDEIEARVAEHVAMVDRVGLTPAVSMFAVNGDLARLSGNAYGLFRAYQEALDTLTHNILLGRVPDHVPDIYGFILQREGFVKRYSEVVLGAAAAGEAAVGLDSHGPAQVELGSRVLGPRAQRSRVLRYLHAPGTQDMVKPVSQWLVLTPSTARMLIQAAVDFLLHSESTKSRVAFVFNWPNTQPDALVQALYAVSMLESRRDKVPAFLQAMLASEELWDSLLFSQDQDHTRVSELAAEAGLLTNALRDLMASGPASLPAMQDVLASNFAMLEALGIGPGQAAIVTNGRIVLMPEVEPRILRGDLEVTEYVALHLQPGMRVHDAIVAAQDAGRTSVSDSDDELSSDDVSNMAMVAASIAARPALEGAGVSAYALRRFTSENMQKSLQAKEAFENAVDLPTLVNVQPSKQKSVGLAVQAWLDPLSSVAQQVAPLMLAMTEQLGASVQILLNPSLGLEALPLKSYYAFALPDMSASPPSTPAAVFQRLPSQMVLTMNTFSPESWLTEVVEASMDLDNIKLSALEPGATLEVRMQLEALVLTGACTDVSAVEMREMRPRGVQLMLGTNQEPHMHDTLVMSNLGYFQLRTAPGLWQLRLAGGRSAEMYAMVHGDIGRVLTARTAGVELPLKDSDALPLLLHSLSGAYVKPMVRKLPEFAGQDVLLDANAAASGLSPTGDEGEVVNIFTIASGHMYERLQKIMMLSVLRHTKARVKFWLIKNYMSPQMKAVMPLMAKHYGFEVEMVTYKWPVWLHKQSEKQRIIWAYKILFLDVLFPLNVKRVIFCDSDQIIRTDMAELFHMDLHGKPLAYTPMCDNNKEMDGYRFWRTGFWEGHLRGKPYHISALYVVDVERFRQLAAGDQLRIMYDSLSKDPNSLSNLDQDLPNYAQHQVPIHSLPQEWLWCESWCGNATKPAAKTIDLCNNPATKEPKLQAARRIVKEWPEYDAEVARFTQFAQGLTLEDVVPLAGRPAVAGVAVVRDEL